jgi:hypothetical protein
MLEKPTHQPSFFSVDTDTLFGLGEAQDGFFFIRGKPTVFRYGIN